ncbi:NitT/TauT family transport system substrate-binding protein [Desulfitispora alkaliphila]|uniref:ABC transporter substrate-binding protein n=1 Tax=Desulfitispora alkaliphila TaxID=622674 RepID=UPI003D1A1045
MKNKTNVYLLIILLVTAVAVVGCGSESTESDDKIPTIYVSYIFVDHQAPLFVALEKGDYFAEYGTYLEPVIEGEKYNLISNDKVIADIELVVSKSGSESATMFAQGNLDIGLFSTPAALSSIDNGTGIKILGPVHTEGLGLVFPVDNPLDGWDEFLEYVAEQDEPVSIGYHSPTSAPKIVFEGALHRAGIDYTSNPNNIDADILMVDLKATNNLSPALTSGQVDGWVGPSPHPLVAETNNTGRQVMELKDLPPEGHWCDFPCCIVAASDELLENYRDIAVAFMNLMTKSSEYANDNRESTANINAKWLGIPAEAAALSEVHYTTNPTSNWVNGVDIYLEVLNEMGNFTGQLKEKSVDQVEDIIFDFSIVNDVL